MSAHDEAGFPGYAEASPSPAAVSPSPALSAYSYASEASELDEGDDAQFSLDDWGMPSSSSARHSSMGAEANGNQASSIHSRAATGSGSATPVNPGSGILTKLSSPNVTPMNSRNGSSIGQAHGSALSPARAFEADQQQAAGSSRAAGGSPLARPPAHEQDAGDMADAMDGDAGDEFDLQDEDEEDMHASGVPAARGWKLDARLSDTLPFKEKVLEMFSKVLSLAGWREADVDPALRPLNAEHLHLRRISGALTNAVFFVSYKPPSGASAALPPTVLLRVYGVGTEVLLSRRGELLILHTLSSLYEIGPHILGTFANGRVEEYFPCEPIGKDGIRDLGTREEYINKKGELHVKGVEGTAQWVARRMRELHEVPLDVMRTVLEQGDLHAPSEKGFGRGIQNHIMACSHRPRNRRGSSRPRGAGSALPGMSALRDGLPGGRNLMRESPGPMQQVQTPEAMTPGAAPGGTSLRAIAAEGAKQAHEDNAAEAKSTDEALAAEWRAKFDINRNGSVTSVGSYGSAASFDSLATSFDSRASISSSASSDSRAGADEEDPSQKPTTPTSTAVTTPINPYFPAGPESKAERPPSASRSSSNGSASRRPYPGVWRRMKRWSREAAKVLQLFDDFAQSPVGRAACKQALRSAPQEVLAAAGNIDETTGQEMDLLRTLSHKKLITSDMLSSTSGNLCNTLLCIVAMDFPRLMRELDTFKRFIRDWERREGQSKRVFAHNDSQYGNLLVVKPQPQAAASKGADELVQLPASGMPRNSPAPGAQSHQRKDSAMSTKSMSTASTAASATPGHGSGAGIPARRGSTSQSRASKRAQPHQQVVVIDFEYASPNPRAYDIANHFHEWRVDYHHPTLSWSLTHHGAYPDKEQRHKWLRAYVQQGRLLRMRNGSSKSAAMLEYNSTPSSSQAQTPTEFSLGPPAIAPAKPAPLDAAAASATLRRQQQGMPATSSPSLTPFLRGVCSPRSPWTTSDVTLPNGVANTSLARLDASIEREVERLEREVDMWSPASHAVWGLWGIVFGRAEIEAVVERVLEAAKDANADGAAAGISVPDEALLLKAEEKAQEAGAEEAFDYLRYALGRIELFRYEVKDLGII